jgi:hypothetical protein
MSNQKYSRKSEKGVTGTRKLQLTNEDAVQREGECVLRKRNLNATSGRPIRQQTPRSSGAAW